METVFFVYLLTFANQKVYVGMSKTDSKGGFTVRYRGHARDAAGGKVRPVYNAWRKHGAPTQTILSTHETRDACALAEIVAIQQHDSMNPDCGYNLMGGGQGLHAPPGSAMYELMRVKVWHNAERRRKSSEALKGRPLPDTVTAAHRAWRESAEGRAVAREISQSPEARAKLAAAMARRLANGYREYVSEVQKGKPRHLSAEGIERRDAARRAWLDSEDGRAKNHAALVKARATPGAAEKRAAAALAHARSDANRAHCAAMSERASVPVRDLATGIMYPSYSAAARAFGVKPPTVSYWVKKGKFERGFT